MHVIAMTTCPDKKSAEKLADSILKEKSAACVTMLPGVTSKYRWKGKIEKGSEVLLIIKTRERALRRLEKTVMKGHPYELPEFLVLDVEGSKKYLQWIGKETKA